MNTIIIGGDAILRNVGGKEIDGCFWFKLILLSEINFFYKIPVVNFSNIFIGDSSIGFHGPQHPDSVWNVMTEFLIGDIVETSEVVPVLNPQWE